MALQESSRAFVRMGVLALLGLAVWLLCAWANQPRSPLLSAAPGPAQFSAARANTTLARLLGPERPHPVGTAENAAVRGRILKELATLAVPARTYTAFSCNSWRGFSFIACATVTDVIAEIVPGSGKAILMLAHYDSVPAGPGASDDESGVATILETIRALKASHESGKHPIIALFSDGEETGLLGANAFLENPALKARIGAVMNMEARGTSGQSLLFQTSPGDAQLVDLYAAHAPVMATSSLYAEIYKFLPNDTDLTLFIRAGFPSFNFAFADNVRYYHSPLDRRANLDRATLQMHGDNLLGVMRGLQQADFRALKSGNDVYIGVLSVWLPRLPAAWALPLSILALVLIALAAWRTRDTDVTRGGMLMSAFMPLALLAGSVLFGFALAFLAQMVSGHPDPTYAYPVTMRVALGVGVWGMALLVSRMAGLHGAATAAWVWMAGLAAITAATLPGLSPYFLFPSLIAAVLLLAASFVRGGWRSAAGQGALLVSAIAALVIWLGLAVGGEALMGLKLHPLFTVPAAFALLTLVPLLAQRPMPIRVWSNASIACLAIALLLSAVAGLLPAYSIASPQRVNLLYFESGSHSPRWIADTAWKANGTEPIPEALMDKAHFQYTSDVYFGQAMASGYVAPAGAPRYPLPLGAITSDRQEGAVRIVSLLLRGSADTSAMSLRIPKGTKLRAIRIRRENVLAPDGWDDDTRIYCDGPDCRDLALTLTLGNAGALEIPFTERRYGLPPFGEALAAARPASAMPSQSGDGVILANTLTISTK
jgi:hypothetical protein